ncbi:hypothetical protein NHH88_07170 [Oxalobacteraceae bacterium OTU3CAMAD1]|nr:hypothetical protein NHH88_07170 [Oxalobacteraceae bacterium OTU3CAMAD1]
MDHMDQTTVGRTADLSKRNYSKLSIIAVTALSIGVSGCSSKPGESDIKTSLATEFQCPILEINDVKKTDGAELGNHSYEVSYTFKVALKGGSTAAQKLLPEINVLNERWERGRSQHERAANAVAMSDNPAPLEGAVSRAKDEVLAVRKRLAEIQPCELPNAHFAIERMRAASLPKADFPDDGIPVGLVMRGTSAMVKAESGWRFAEPPRFDVNAEKVSRDSSVHLPRPNVLWTEFSQKEGAFVASVPSQGQCSFAEKDAKTGQEWWQCSYGTPDTDMIIWFGKLASPQAHGSDDLNAKIKSMTEQRNEQITEVTPSALGNVSVADFSAKSADSVRRGRIFYTGRYEIQAIAAPVAGRTANLAEMKKFTDGVLPPLIEN